jgi:uncharacterized membrane protein
MGNGPLTETLENLNLTKRSKTLGLPIGRSHPDWVKLGLLGAGVAASVVGGAGAKRGAGKVADRVREPVDKAKDTVEKASDAGEKASSIGQAMSEKSNPITKAGAALRELGDGGSQDRNVKKLRLIVNESVDVAVPRRTAYNQWTQFEELPSILKGVVSVEQQEDDVTRWTAKIGPSRRRWTAEIDEQAPDERIVWHSTEGAEHRGTITFHQLDGNLTRIQVEMEYFPSGLVEKLGNVFLVARRRVRKDLRLFKHYMALAGEETGAWRGEISKDDERHAVDQPEDEGSEQEPSAKQDGERPERAAREHGKRAKADGRESQRAEGDKQRAEDEGAGRDKQRAEDQSDEGDEDRVGSQS